MLRKLARTPDILPLRKAQEGKENRIRDAFDRANSFRAHCSQSEILRVI